MPYHIQQMELARSSDPFRRALQYAYYDWTREMPKSKRLMTWAGHLMQGYAFYALWTRSLVWPLMWPEGIPLYASVLLLYVVGAGLKDGMLTAEFCP